MCDVTFASLPTVVRGIHFLLSTLHRHKQYARARALENGYDSFSGPPLRHRVAEHWKPNRPVTVGRDGGGVYSHDTAKAAAATEISRHGGSATPRRSAAVSAGPEILTVRSGSRLLCALIVHTATSITPPGTHLEHVVEMHPDIR